MFVFSIFVFGFMSALRSFGKFRDAPTCARSDLAKIGTVMFSILICTAIIAVFSPTIAVVLMCAQMFAAHKLDWLVLRWKSILFEREKIFLLSFLLLKMKSGYSLRTAVADVLLDFEKQNSTLAPVLRQIHESIALGAVAKSLFAMKRVSEFTAELIRADQNSHHCMAGIFNLRACYKKQSDFRQRSGQVLVQIRAQAVILTVLYLALIIFMTVHYGAHKFLELRIISAGFFILGLILIFYLGQKVKWKV